MIPCGMERRKLAERIVEGITAEDKDVSVKLF
jgi:hypothetical protein